MSFRYSSSSGNWWYPWFMSSLLKTLQSLNVVMKSSVIGACTCRECCMDLFNTRISRLTQMSLGFFGFGWTTSGGFVFWNLFHDVFIYEFFHSLL